LISYNAAVKKFLVFARTRSSDPFTLPASPADLYKFAFWAGRTTREGGSHKVLATTVTKYLCGIKAWHVFHDATYPPSVDKKLALMVKASGRKDARIPKKPRKAPVMIPDLLILADALTSGTPMDQAIFDLALVAFWGLARLGEVTLGTPSYASSEVLASDVQLSADNQSIQITLREAKTAVPGELQWLSLQALPDCLCPVKATKRLHKGCTDADDALFGYRIGGIRLPLTKNDVTTRLREIWASAGQSNLTGHSFRVGGALLRHALGVSVADICAAGQWKSSCYKLYIRP
jgi:hypothetical protein